MKNTSKITGIVGGGAQKLVNYGYRPAIIGEFQDAPANRFMTIFVKAVITDLNILLPIKAQ